MPKLIKLPTVQALGANQTALVPELPLGMTYRTIYGEMGGTTMTKALMTAMRFALNGKTFIDNLAGSHLDAQNQFKKKTANAAYWSLHFAEAEARTLVGEDIGGIDTSVGVDTFDIELDMGAISADATLTLWASVSPPKEITINGQPNENKTTIPAILKKTHTPSGAADNVLVVPMGSRLGGLVKRIHFHHTGNVTHIEVKRDNTYFLQKMAVALLGFIYGERNRTAQANHVAWDPCWTDNQSDAVPTVRQQDEPAPGTPAYFETTVTTSAADTITSYTELYTKISLL